jgi:hypothetical protein
MHKVACCLVALLACSAMQATAARSLFTLGLLLGPDAPCSNNASPVAPLSSGSKWRADLSGDKNIKPNTTGVLPWIPGFLLLLPAPPPPAARMHRSSQQQAVWGRRLYVYRLPIQLLFGGSLQCCKLCIARHCTCCIVRCAVIWVSKVPAAANTGNTLLPHHLTKFLHPLNTTLLLLLLQASLRPSPAIPAAPLR